MRIKDPKQCNLREVLLSFTREKLIDSVNLTPTIFNNFYTRPWENTDFSSDTNGP